MSSVLGFEEIKRYRYQIALQRLHLMRVPYIITLSVVIAKYLVVIADRQKANWAKTLGLVVLESVNGTLVEWGIQANVLLKQGRFKIYGILHPFMGG